MKVLLDTSYFLPLIKIKIEEIPENLLLELLKESKHHFFYSELSIFEIAAKGLKMATKKKKIVPQDVMRGIDSIQNDSRLTRLSWSHNPLIMELSSSFRAIHADTIDCFIFATAVCKCECIATMDNSFYLKIKQDASIVEKIQQLNNNFQFWFKDLSDRPVGL